MQPHVLMGSDTVIQKKTYMNYVQFQMIYADSMDYQLLRIKRTSRKQECNIIVKKH